MATNGSKPVASQSGEFLSVSQAASILQISEVSIRRYLTLKRLRRFKVGSRTLLKREDVLSLVREA